MRVHKFSNQKRKKKKKLWLRKNTNPYWTSPTNSIKTYSIQRVNSRVKIYQSIQIWLDWWYWIGLLGSIPCTLLWILIPYIYILQAKYWEGLFSSSLSSPLLRAKHSAKVFAWLKARGFRKESDHWKEGVKEEKSIQSGSKTQGIMWQPKYPSPWSIM